NTLEAMIEQVANFFPHSTLFCPMIDARRMEVYTLVANSQREILMPTSAVVVEANTFENYLNTGKVVFFGNGAEKCRKVILHPNAIFLENIYPVAKSMGKLAWQKFQEKAFENLFYFEPYYLKEFLVSKPRSK
ncbi:MAG: tRNA (adenosine(37)-N6)-threonylcarbamoyltransferase complex dimerization subunit type 1 TsaB, partial [Raineya sp.]|nr:tRNA (adenosine(37)-N6)-threonylcarbamoyltransferase complex dimerization subunit type 1 TsaB [Raineya sp.]